LEISQKAASSAGASSFSAKQDAGTLSLALKAFKSELADKEKEVVRMKKDIADLHRTNASLKREREKYLNLANALSASASASGGGVPAGFANKIRLQQQQKNKQMNLIGTKGDSAGGDINQDLSKSPE
jgi:hypothetical protein